LGLLTVQHGGLSSDKGQKSAKQVFKALAGSTGERVTLSLICDSDWICSWPLPQSPLRAAVGLVIQNGVLDLTPLRALSEGDGHDSRAKAWVKELDRLCRKPVGKIAVLGLVEIGFGSSKLRPFFAQILWAMSLALERVLGSQAKTANSEAFGRVRFEWVDWRTAFARDRESFRDLYNKNNKIIYIYIYSICNWILHMFSKFP
jgi:hypothetical protein